MSSFARRCGAFAALYFAVFPYRPHAPSGGESMSGHMAEVAVPRACSEPGRDSDGDGIADACEQALAETYAPIVYHPSNEPNLPTNVDAFLEGTSLSFFDEKCSPAVSSTLRRAPKQEDLLGVRSGTRCGTPDVLRSDGTRSVRKARTFFLSDVAQDARRGSTDSRAWTTYVHAYRNDIGGVTIQYWRFYAYNDAMTKHGGDWEGMHVVLDASFQPRTARLLGHTGIEEMPFTSLELEGTHPRVFSEPGGHATRPRGSDVVSDGCKFLGECTIDPGMPQTFIRQETWPGGEVRFPDGRRAANGELVNLGSKTHPMNGQVFLRYAGLWGSPGRIYSTSGYWGPAYNETAMKDDGFVTAWCEGMAGNDLRAECYPESVSR